MTGTDCDILSPRKLSAIVGDRLRYLYRAAAILTYKEVTLNSSRMLGVELSPQSPHHHCTYLGRHMLMDLKSRHIKLPSYNR